MAGNQAIDLNPPTADEHLTTQASDWLWAAFSFIALSTLAAAFLSFFKPRGSRLFHQLAVVILTTSSIAYFSMASDLGATPIDVEFRGDGSDPSRQIYYVRYIQWFINFPLLLTALLLTTGLPALEILTTLFMAAVTVVCGLVGALVHSDYKWGYYVFGVVALFHIWYVLLWHAPTQTATTGALVRRGYFLAAGLFALLTLTYPIAWACAEGGNVISVDSEMIWYGILDVLAGPCWLALFLWEVSGIDFAYDAPRGRGRAAAAPVAEKPPVPVEEPAVPAPAVTAPEQQV